MRFSKMFIAVGVSATVIIVAVAVFSVFRVATTIPAEQVVAGSRNANGQARPNASEVQAGAASTAVEQNVKPIDTKVGSVAGVDLSGLASDANQTAATSAQDGSSDVKDISASSQTINSSIDSVNNPIQ